jgi:hypothetical protein
VFGSSVCPLNVSEDASILRLLSLGKFNLRNYLWLLILNSYWDKCFILVVILKAQVANILLLNFPLALINLHVSISCHIFGFFKLCLISMCISILIFEFQGQIAEYLLLQLPCKIIVLFDSIDNSDQVCVIF